MAGNNILELTDCTPLRQTLLAKPPRIVHGAVMLIATFLTVAVVWSFVTQADLVVRAPGRVRPKANPDIPIGGVEVESRVCAVYSGRVTEVHVKEGYEVTQGQVLMRIDTETLDNEIARLERSIETDRIELAQIHELEQLLQNEFEATQAKTKAELVQVIDQVNQDKQRRSSQIELALLALDDAQIKLRCIQQLVDGNAATDHELRDAQLRASEAQTRLEAAKIPVEKSRIEVLRKAMAQNAQNHALELGRLHLQVYAKQGLIEAAKFELANLHVRRRHTVLTAQTDGLVTALNVQVGDVIESGAPVVAITDQRGFRIDLDVPSDQVGHLRVGMPARVRLDAYDYQVYGTLGGTVEYIAPDTVVTSMPDGQVVASYTVRVALANDCLINEEHRGDIKLGMTGQAEIITDQESIFSLMFRGIRRSFSLG